MKKLILTCVFLTSTIMVSTAQQTANGEPQRLTPEIAAENRAANWDKMLGLTPEQHKQAYAIELVVVKQIFDIKNGAKKNMSTEMEQANKIKDEKFKAILTPEQWAKYDVAMHPKPMPSTPQEVAPGK